jgi:hypothetical protein
MKFINIALLSSCIVLSACSYSGPSQRSGQIVKIASEGFINRTTEVEIIKGSLGNGSGAFGSRFDFTINNPGLLLIANKAFEEGKEIIVSYHSNAICPLSSSNRLCNFADNIVISKE